MPSLMAILGLDGSQFSHGLDRAKGEASSKGSSIGSALSGKIQAALAAGVGVEMIKKVFGMMEKEAEGAHLAILSASKMGIEPEKFIQYEAAAKKFGLSGADVATAFKKIAVGSQEALGGSEELQAAFKTLGITTADLKNKSVDAIFDKIGESMEGGTFNAARMAAAIKTMGRSADDLVPAFKAGAFTKLSPFADSASEIEAAEKYHKDMAVIGSAMKRVWHEMFSIENNGHIASAVSSAADVVRKMFGIKKDEPAVKPMDLKVVAAGDIKANEAAKVKEIKDAKELIHLELELKNQQAANVLDRLNNEQKIVELKKRQAELEKASSSKGVMSPEGRLQAAIQIEKYQNEIERLAEKGEKPPAATHQRTLSINSLQQIGAYAGSPIETQALDVHKKSEGHLKTLVGKMDTLISASQKGGTKF